MRVSLEPAEDFRLVMNLFQYYLYDMSEYMGWSPDEDGAYRVDESRIDLGDYWTEPDHFPYLILADGELAGFSLIRKYPGSTDTFDIGQFFVLRKFKGTGVGRSAFNLTVATHPGKWITRVLPENRGAYEFWQKVISQRAAKGPEIRNGMYGSTEMNFFYYEVQPR